MKDAQTIHIITEPTRFQLLQLLCQHQYCVRAISKKLNISESAVSQHMSILKKHRIVYGVKIGYQVHYQVDKERFTSLLNEIIQEFSQYPEETEISKNCSCEFISECFRRDTNILEE